MLVVCAWFAITKTLIIGFWPSMPLILLHRQSAVTGYSFLIRHNPFKIGTLLLLEAFLMRISSIVLLIFTVSTLALPGCAWVELKPQGEKVKVLTVRDTRKCKKIGHVTSNTTDSIAYIPRDSDSVNDELNRLARNYAGQMGGNAIVPTGQPQQGEQSFNVFYCK